MADSTTGTHTYPQDPETFAATIRSFTSLDTEMAHVEMDRAMVAQLRALGYHEAMDLYDTQPKWHA